MKKLRIAQVAPTWYSIPPAKYGGAERIIASLCDTLTDHDYDVTLFANGDSRTKAKLISIQDKSPEISQETLLNFEYNMKHLFNHFLAAENQKQFDIIHWHISKDLLPMMISNIITTPSVITFHNFYPQSNVGSIYNYYQKNQRRGVYYVSVSNDYTKDLPIKFFATVYNGIDIKPFHFSTGSGGYIFWIGRFLQVKGPHLAIKVAQKLNLPLKMAARKVGNIQLEYYKSQIEPFLNNKIEYVGEVGQEEKNKLYGQATVLLNPIIKKEPFGLVVPEANACGTPVVAFARGSMSELIKDGVNGFLVEPDNIDEMARVIEKIYNMSEKEYQILRTNCRKYVEKNFTVNKMTDGYEKVYQEVIEEEMKRKQRKSN